MTHEYTILLGGTVRPTPDRPHAADLSEASEARFTAIAWAHDTILAVGTDAEVRSISRGDSRFVELDGAQIVPLADWLEPGAAADFDILAPDPATGSVRVIAAVRRGQVVDGRLP